MLKNYLTTALRNFLRHKGYSFINTMGLAVGLACSIFIMLWVLDETRYDAFHTDNDRLYQILENQTYSESQIFTFAATPGKLALALQEEIPEVEYACRTTWGDRLLFTFQDKAIFEEGLYADSTLFKMFTFPILSGDVNNPLPDVNSVAISKKLAAKFFDNDDVLGKVFKVGNTEMNVTAVFQDLPENSSIKFDFVIPFQVYAKENSWLEHWGNNGIQTFIKLKSQTNYKEVNKKIIGFVKEKNEGSVVDIFLHPMNEWRLYSNFEKGKQAGGRITYVRAFSIVAFFILLIACINFMNLATARSANRTKEVGVRKSVGAQRRSLIVQFMGESVMQSFLSLGIALVVVYLLMPFFNDITGKKLVFALSDHVLVLWLVGITLFTGLLAGSYPALFLSSFKPALVLKGNVHTGLRGASLRQVLVVIQFALSVILIVSAIVVYNQIEYIRNKNLGFDKEHILYFTRYGGIQKSFDAFRNQALQTPIITHVAQGNQLPYNVGSSTGDVDYDGRTDDDKILFQIIQVDYDYLEALGFTFVDGRNFSREAGTDTVNFIVNEEAARRMRMESPVGSRLEFWGRTGGQVIGVVKDFHSVSLRAQLEPVIFVLAPENSWRVFVRYAPGKAEDAIKHLEAIHKQIEPTVPFEHNFLDKNFERQYRSEMTTGKLSIVFTIIAILISCLGLFGLASFMTERRAKEIGVRKVLGASVPTLIMMLCKDFTRLVMVAIVIGCPIAWYVMDKFLAQYAFHTQFGMQVFAITAAVMLGIALATVVYQSAKAALSNPVSSLRSE
jgi:putative ABC transport system permease protein